MSVEDYLGSVSSHPTCLYAPGKIEGKPTQFLLDSGSTENILSKRLFDSLPAQVKDSLQPEDLSAHLADGSSLIIYGTIDLHCRLRTTLFTTTFKVANITDHAILGMHFFRESRSSLHLAHGTLEIAGQLIACVD